MIVSDEDEQQQHDIMINSYVQNDEGDDECGLAKMQKGIDTTLELLNVIYFTIFKNFNFEIFQKRSSMK